jgi:hypothetical protein
MHPNFIIAGLHPLLEGGSLACKQNIAHHPPSRPEWSVEHFESECLYPSNHTTSSISSCYQLPAALSWLYTSVANQHDP